MLVGIDLGTTHSLIAFFGPQGPSLIPNALGEMLTPSVVALDDQGGVLVGQAAKDRLITHPEATMAAFKRWMGSNRQTALGSGRYRPEQLSALVLRSLLDDARAHLRAEITEAVISVPAYFSDAQRKATRLAGEMAGVKVELLVNEPTAAALAYGLQRLEGERRFLVFDLGGGTLDVSILEIFEGVVEVRASAGDNWLGGEDFLEVLVKDFESNCLTRTVASLDLGQQAQLRRRLELAKKQLSADANVQIEAFLPKQTSTWKMTQERFTQLCEPLLQRMRSPLERAIRDARLKPDQIDEVVLVGGASRMPMVTQLVTRMLGRLPLRHLNPDHAIALGAAAFAGMKANDERLREVVMTDVCPYSLGTDVGRKMDNGKVDAGYFYPIIQRNSTVPVSREEIFYPMAEQQEVVNLGIYQGESPWVKNNIKLGELEVPLGPPGECRGKSVKVRFTYDVNGILQVEASVVGSERRYEVLLQQGEATMSREEIRIRMNALHELKVHPRDQQENLALLARAERVYEEYVHDRTDVHQWIALFRQVLESQDLALVKEHRRQLTERLDGLERLS